MTQFRDAAQALAETMAASQERLGQLDKAWPNDASPLTGALELAKRYSELQQDWANQVTRFWSGMPGMAGFPAATLNVEPKDKQLAGETWETGAWPEAVKRVYLSYCKVLDTGVDSSPVEERTKE